MPNTIIGGNMLSPFYSTAYFVGASGSQSAPQLPTSGNYWAFPFVKAFPRRRRGLADVTHSWYPTCRGVRQTQVTWDCLLHVFLNPDLPPEAEVTLASGFSGYQMYLTLGSLANYPTVDTNQYYWWVPSVFIEQIPHTLDLSDDPVRPIMYDMIIRSNSPAFFLPTDGGSNGPIQQFLTYIQSLNWAF